MFRWIQLADIGDLDDRDEGVLLSLIAGGPSIDVIIVLGGLRSQDQSLHRSRRIIQELRRLAPVVAVPSDGDREMDDDELVVRVFREWDKDPSLREQLGRGSGSKTFDLAARRFGAVRFVEERISCIDVAGRVDIGEQGNRFSILALNSELLAPAKDQSGRPLRVISRRLVELAGDGPADIVAMRASPRELDAESQQVLDTLHPGALHVSVASSDVPHVSSRRVISCPSLRDHRLFLVGESDPLVVRAVALEGSGTRVIGHAPEVHVRDPRMLQRLLVKNFRGIEALDVPLSTTSPLGGAWTCLAGINGAGKTSVLQALALALIGHRDALQLGIAGLARMRRRVDGRSVDAWIRIENPTMSRDLTLTKRGPEGSDYPETTLVLAYGATRNLSEYDDKRHAEKSPAARRVITLFDPLAQVAQAEVLLEGRADERVLSLLSRVATGVFERSLDVSALNGRVTFRQGDESLAAIDLPDGFRSSMAWLADLCAAWCQHQPDLDDPEDIKAVVLIDEIDLHLHPSLQRALVPRLRRTFPNVQWIVTTHSPLVLGSFDASEIVALDRGASGGIRQIDRQILGFSSDQIYQWLMDTPPVSTAIEQQLRTPAAVRALDDDAIERILATSETVNDEGATKTVERRRALLAKLQKGEL